MRTEEDDQVKEQLELTVDECKCAALCCIPYAIFDLTELACDIFCSLFFVTR